VSDAGARSRLPLVAVDALALLAFVLVGVEHHTSGTPANLARTGGALLLAWFALALLVGAYRRPGVGTLAATWALAIPAGAVLRSAIRGGPWDDRLLVFAGVALAFSALFLLAGRALIATARWVADRRAGPARR